MEDDKLFLTYEQAVSMLSDDDQIHTFRSNVMCLLGADWDRAELLEAIKNGKPRVGGSQCKALGHGLVVFTGNEPLFIETKNNAPEEFEEAQKQLITTQGKALETPAVA